MSLATTQPHTIRRPAWPRALARTLAGLVTIIAVTAAGIGWLYLLRGTGALRVGPMIHHALPLQRLAGGAAQPLLRFVVAWLPAGLVAGVALRALGLRRGHRAIVTGGGVAALLLAAGALADAVTANESVRSHLAAQPHRAATWIAALLAAAGAAL